MIAAGWGLKDKLIADHDVWLCHNCGDCTTLCPRGAKPGDVLSAIRAYTVGEYAVPKNLAKQIRDPKKLPVLMAIPAVIFIVLGLLSNMVGLNWFSINPSDAHLWQADYINNYLVDIIMIPTFNFAIIVFLLGLYRFITDVHKTALAEGKTTRNTFEVSALLQALIKVVPRILSHARFNECSENKERAVSHMMVLFGFIGLFIVTASFFIAEWVLGIEGPYSQMNPIKWLGNISGIALIVGGILLVKSRLAKSDSVSSYWDWYLVGLVLALGGTGMLTESLRLAGLFDLSAVIYFFHLIFVWCLFAYTPFSKLAHIAYRTAAMVYDEYASRT
jgi:quinone-modifying oxidoreductase subunit QmoC